MDFIAQLTDEHQDYVLKFSALAEIIEGIRVNGRGDYFVSGIDSLLPAFAVDLDNHAGREEEFLFSRLMERVPDSPVPLMLEEHRLIREYSATFADRYKGWRDGNDRAYEGWARAALDLRGIFSTHMQKENLILFPMARRILTADEISQWTKLADT